MHAIHYIETSALNLFSDQLQDFDFVYAYQKAMKVDICISSVVIWEILLNTDESKKEKLIYWAQFNCANYLLKSPAEIIIEYLSLKAPLKDRKEFWTSRKTNLAIGKTWTNIHRRIDLTIPIDLDAIRSRSELLRQFSRSYKDIICSMTDEKKHGHDGDFFHRMMLLLREKLNSAKIQSHNKDSITKTSLVLAYFFVCIGFDLDNTPVRKFWEPLKIEDPFERLEYLVAEIPKAIVRGPLIEMAIMMNAQMELPGKTNRGAVFDALHSIYCYYSDNIISNDPHFTNLANRLNHEIYDGIISAEIYVTMMKTAYDKVR